MTEFALGAHVVYHHRAAVARWMTRDRPSGVSGRWGLFEGAHRHSYRLEDGTHEIDLFADLGEIKRNSRVRDPINKTVMVWPEEGSGVIIGKVRRQRGTSHRATGGSGGPFGDDFDPGYFDPTDSFELYALRHDLRGLDYILVPTWAVRLDLPATQEGQPGLAGDASV